MKKYIRNTEKSIVLGLILLSVSVVSMAMAKIPLLIDTDMMDDDWLAISYLLSHPGVDILGITVSGTGGAHPEAGTCNLIRMLDRLGRSDIPVATGNPQPVLGGRALPDRIRDLVDSFLGLPLPPQSRPLPEPDSAARLIVNALMTSSQPVTILALAPWTNLAHAFQRTPEAIKSVERIIAMGGAVNREGNIHHIVDHQFNNLTAEWNFYLDPGAVAQVFQYPLAIDLVPLNATDDVPLKAVLVEELQQLPSSSGLILMNEIFSHWFAGTQPATDYYLWDLLAAVAITHPEVGVWQQERVQISLDQSADPDTFGALEAVKDGRQIRYAASADPDIFHARLLEMRHWAQTMRPVK